MQERQLRRRQPGRFPPGPLESALPKVRGALEASGLVGRAYRQWRARAGPARPRTENDIVNAREVSEPI